MRAVVTGADRARCGRQRPVERDRAAEARDPGLPDRKNGQALQTLLTTFPRGGLTPLLFAARQGSLDAARALVDGRRRREPGAIPTASARWCWRSATATTTWPACWSRRARTSNAGEPRRPYAAVHGGRHALARLDSEPAAPRAEGTLDSVDLVQAAARPGRQSERALSAAPPGWKGDTIAAQNTFGNVLGPGATPFMRAAKNADLP